MLPEPTRVTLALRGVEPRVAFQKLFEQAKFPPNDASTFGFEYSASRKVTLDVTDEPFLLAMLELCRQGAMEPGTYNMGETGMSFHTRMMEFHTPSGPTTLGLMRGSTTQRGAMGAIHPTTRATPEPSWVDAPAVASGPFAFVPREFEQRNWINIGSHLDHGPNEMCNLVINVLREIRSCALPSAASQFDGRHCRGRARTIHPGEQSNRRQLE